MLIALIISQAVKDSSKIAMTKNSSGVKILEASLTAENRSDSTKCARIDVWQEVGYFKKLSWVEITLHKINMPENTL